MLLDLFLTISPGTNRGVPPNIECPAVYGFNFATFGLILKIENIVFVNVYCDERRGLICTVFSGFLIIETKYAIACSHHEASWMPHITLPSERILKHVWGEKTLISLDNINVLAESKSLLTGLSKPSFGVAVFLLSYVSK